MTETEIASPSYARVRKAQLTSASGVSYNLIDHITEFYISQSIDSVSLKGSLKILDSIGLLEDFPLRGEETLDLELEGLDTGVIKRIKAHVYSIGNIVVTDNNDAVGYDMNFVSDISYGAGKRRIIEPYETIISEIVKSIFSKYFFQVPSPTRIQQYGVEYFQLTRDKGLYIQPTEGIFRCIIPRYVPTEAMLFLASRSYSSDSKSCAFRFFETMDAFYFVTDEFLIQKSIDETPKKFFYNAVTSKTPENMYEQIINLDVLENSDRIDVPNDIYSGSYRNNVIEIDLLRKTVNNLRFDYTRDADFLKTSGEKVDRRPKHTQQFIEQTFTEENERRFLLFKDYASPGDIPGQLRGDQYIPRIVSNKVSYLHHINNTAVSAQIKGRLDIQAGETVSLEVLEFTLNDVKKKNPQLSGNYIVRTVIHSCVGENLTTTMNLIKYDWE